MLEIFFQWFVGVLTIFIAGIIMAVADMPLSSWKDRLVMVSLFTLILSPLAALVALIVAVF